MTFYSIKTNSTHVQPYLPDQTNIPLRLHTRPRRSNHNLQLPIRTTTLNDRNFLMKALHKDMNYSQASSQH